MLLYPIKIFQDFYEVFDKSYVVVGNSTQFMDCYAILRNQIKFYYSSRIYSYSLGLFFIA